MTEEEVQKFMHDEMFAELCKHKAIKQIRDCHTAIDITIESLRKKAGDDVDIYDNPVFVELVSFLILKATKDKESGIGGDHIIEGALLLAVSEALKSRREAEEEKNSNEN